MGDNCPWLLISYCVDGVWVYENQSLYDAAKNRCYDATSPELESKRVLASSFHGWLVLTDDFLLDDCCLWNPKSREKIQLPLLQNLHMYDAVVLTKPPTEPDCHIIFNSRTRDKQAYCKIGDDAFKTRDWRLNAIRSSRGRIYGVDGVLRYRLVSLEFVGQGGELQLRPIFELEGTQEWSSNDYLVESDDELLLLRMRQPTLNLVHCRQFRVFRLHPERMECVEVGSIGDRTLFVAEYGDALCCSSSANKTKPNAVYYTRDGCRSLCIYNLDDGSTTTLLPSPDVHRVLSYATWIQQQPSHQLLLTKINEITLA